MIQVAVYVPTLNRRSMLLETLRGLAEQTVAVEIVVIDNGSSDGSAEVVRKEYPDVHLVEPGTNRGFGPAINLAVASIPADLLLFTNNDVVHDPTFVEAMVDELGSGQATVAGVLLKGDDPRWIDSAGVMVDSTLLAFDHLHGLPLSALRTADPPLGATGGAALVPYSVFSAVGGFDDRIFAYLEDVDLALRLRTAGVPCRLAPTAIAVHRHSATLGSGSPEKNRLMGWSRGYMLRRYGVLRNPKRAARAVIAEAVICAGQAVIDRNFSAAPGRLRGWRGARGLPMLPIPEGASLDLSLTEALRLRASRRSHRSPSGSGDQAAVYGAASD